jgi:hypothetical protein
VVPEGSVKWNPSTVYPKRERRRMTWVKPKFEVIDLCSEVTSYLYTR